MISKSSINVKVEDPDEGLDKKGRYLIVRAWISANRMLPLDRSLAGDQEVTDHAKHHAAVALWRDIYGDILEKLLPLRMEVLANMHPCKVDRAELMLNELLEMLRHPTREETKRR